MHRAGREFRFPPLRKKKAQEWGTRIPGGHRRASIADGAIPV